VFPTFFSDIPARERRITAATVVTLIRIALAPCVVIAMMHSAWLLAMIFFVVASLSDALDGFLARTFSQQTVLGAYLDPLADKLLLLSSFFTLAFVRSPSFVLPTWFFIIKLLRELILICGSLVIAYWKGPIKVRPTRVGKIATCVEMCFVMWVFACYYFTWVPVKTYYVMLSLMTVLSLVSLAQYIRVGVMHIMSVER